MTQCASDALVRTQEYVPAEDGAAAKLRWEMVQVGYNSSLQPEIAR